MSKTKLFLAFILILSLSFVLTGTTYAKKVLPRAQKTSGVPSAGKATKGVTTSVKFRADRRAIVVTFTGFSVAKAVSYNLIYTSGGVEQSFGGSISDLTGTQTREIVFGTCSHGTCRYDTGIKNAKFVVTTTLTNGKKVVKSYKLKI